jgi:hypothetical protein
LLPKQEAEDDLGERDQRELAAFLLSLSHTTNASLLARSYARE